MSALDDGRQDGLGTRHDPRHQRADRCPASQQCDAQAWLRQQAPGRGQGAWAWVDPVNGSSEPCPSTSMLRLEFASVLRVKNSAELLTEAVGFTRRLGLETLSVMVV